MLGLLFLRRRHNMANNKPYAFTPEEVDQLIQSGRFSPDFAAQFQARPINDLQFPGQPLAGSENASLIDQTLISPQEIVTSPKVVQPQIQPQQIVSLPPASQPEQLAQPSYAQYRLEPTTIPQPFIDVAQDLNARSSVLNHAPSPKNYKELLQHSKSGAELAGDTAVANRATESYAAGQKLNEINQAHDYYSQQKDQAQLKIEDIDRRQEVIQKKIEEFKVDPHRLLQGAPAFIAVIASALGGFAAGFSGTQNSALAEINNVIDKDIDAQKTQLAQLHYLAEQGKITRGQYTELLSRIPQDEAAMRAVSEAKAASVLGVLKPMIGSAEDQQKISQEEDKLWLSVTKQKESEDIEKARLKLDQDKSVYIIDELKSKAAQQYSQAAINGYVPYGHGDDSSSQTSGKEGPWGEEYFRLNGVPKGLLSPIDSNTRTNFQNTAAFNEHKKTAGSFLSIEKIAEKIRKAANSSDNVVQRQREISQHAGSITAALKELYTLGALDKGVIFLGTMLTGDIASDTNSIMDYLASEAKQKSGYVNVNKSIDSFLTDTASYAKNKLAFDNLQNPRVNSWANRMSK